MKASSTDSDMTRSSLMQLDPQAGTLEHEVSSPTSSTPSSEKEVTTNNRKDKGCDTDSELLRRIVKESFGYERRNNLTVTYHPSTGRITALSLGTELSAPFDHHWDLSPTIGLLNSLESLNLTSCRRIPSELGKMQKLKTLILVGCKRMETFPEDLFHPTEDQGGHVTGSHLSQLEELRILGIVPMIPSYILAKLSPLKHLRVLQFSFHSLSPEEETLNLLQFLSPDMQFSDSLQELILNRSHITNRGLDILLRQVVHRFPNLKVLSLSKNQISSLRCLSDEQPGDATNASLRWTQPRLCPLQELTLSHNPVWDLSSTDSSQRERTYLERFLEKSASRISYLGYQFGKSCLWSSSIQHWLDVNKAGRFLFDHGNLGANKSQSNAYDSCDDPEIHLRVNINNFGIVPSLWPRILAKVNYPYHSSDVLVPANRVADVGNLTSAPVRRANVIYYFLRNGPIVMFLAKKG